MPSVERSRCRRRRPDEACGGERAGRGGAGPARRRQRLSRPPSDSQTAVVARSARVRRRRCPRAGVRRRPASGRLVGTAAVRGRRVVRIVVMVEYPRTRARAEPARRGMGRARQRRRWARVRGWVPSGTADPPPPAKGLDAEVASTPTLRASGPPDGRCAWGIGAVQRPVAGHCGATRRDAVQPPDAVPGVASACRSLLVHCIIAAPGPTYHDPAALRWSQAVPP